MRRLLSDLFCGLRERWEHEDRLRMKAIAHLYGELASMNGEVIKSTGQIVARDSA